MKRHVSALKIEFAPQGPLVEAFISDSRTLYGDRWFEAYSDYDQLREDYLTYSQPRRVKEDMPLYANRKDA